MRLASCCLTRTTKPSYADVVADDRADVVAKQMPALTPPVSVAQPTDVQACYVVCGSQTTSALAVHEDQLSHQGPSAGCGWASDSQ